MIQGISELNSNVVKMADIRLDLFGSQTFRNYQITRQEAEDDWINLCRAEVREKPRTL